MKFLKLTALVLSLAAIGVGILIMWASSPAHPESEYSGILTMKNQDTTASDSLFSIVSYNIGFLSGMTNNQALEVKPELYDTNLTKCISVLRSIDPDIFCVQEIDYNSARSQHINQQETIQKIGFPYTAQAVNWDENYLPFPGNPLSIGTHYGKVYSGQSIFSKHPIEETDRKVLSRSQDLSWHRDIFYLDRLAQFATINVGDQRLTVANIHLDAYDKVARDKQIGEILKLVDSKIDTEPLIILGDFNSDASYPDASINRISSDKRLEMAHTGGPKDSFTYPSDSPAVRIDYIFYNPDFIDIQDARVLHEFGQVSDHLPVFASFRFNKLKNTTYK